MPNPYPEIQHTQAQYQGPGHGYQPPKPSPGTQGNQGYNWQTDPQAPWNQLMSGQFPQQYGEQQMNILQNQMGLLSDQLREQIGSSWFNTGATGAGVQSSLPSEAFAKQYGQLARQVMVPGMANIQSNVAQMGNQNLGQAMQMLMQAQQMKAQQEAQQGGGFFESLLGALPGIASIIPGIGQIAGPLMSFFTQPRPGNDTTLG